MNKWSVAIDTQDGQIDGQIYQQLQETQQYATDEAMTL